ncbi:MAG TPA: beta-galactosidase trimerization domain-containing protein, partial [Tepidisphaeraceae bacterium]|nr:beta-galactosidase trimerization domain-containing protein [Tepidisphaeraceae bacterium]
MVILNRPIRQRHIHLDFHTSGAIRDVGAKFSRKQFQEQLRAGHVDSINVFSKCHHGWCYHPTAVGWQHPHLKFDLLGEQIAAAHEIGVRAPVYVSAGLDERYVDEHPGDVVVPLRPRNQPVTEPGYARLCFNSPYLDHLRRQVEEVARRYEVDGWWFDIVGVQRCYCRRCLAEMARRGMDPNNEADALQLAEEVRERYFETVNAAARIAGDRVPISQNAGHIARGDRRYMRHVTHLELESLPTGGWGYDHFPVSAKYAATTGLPYLGMTGKFHTAWGEFGGFKHDNALRYECAAMQAFGAACSIGDQLHPSGEMNPETYRKVGIAYAEVKAKEPWCDVADPVAEVAVVSIEAMRQGQRELHAHLADRNDHADAGAARILLQRQVMFDIVDLDADLSKYRLLIIPDAGRMAPAVAKRFTDYLAAGGKLLLSGASGMDVAEDRFVLPVGTFRGRSGTDMDYLNAAPPMVERDAERRLVRCPFVINGNSYHVEPAPGATVMAELWHSQFNRDIRHFTSHQHAPEHRRAETPGAFVAGNVGYVAAELFSQYYDRGQALYRDLLVLMIETLLGDRGNVDVGLQSAGRSGLTHQPHEQRYVLHLLYGVPMKRAENAFPRWGIKQIEVVEDLVPVFDIPCSV